MKTVTIQQTCQISVRNSAGYDQGIIFIRKENHKAIQKLLSMKSHVVIAFPGKTGLVKFEQKSMISKRSADGSSGDKYLIYIQKKNWKNISGYIDRDIDVKLTFN